jgi:hypothetical protein
MTKPAPDEGSYYNAKIIKEFRANQGRVGGPWVGTTLILIHHIGATSRGRARYAAGLLFPGRRPSRGRRIQRRIAQPPSLVLQPQGQPKDHR